MSSHTESSHTYNKTILKKKVSCLKANLLLLLLKKKNSTIVAVCEYNAKQKQAAAKTPKNIYKKLIIFLQVK